MLETEPQTPLCDSVLLTSCSNRSVGMAVDQLRSYLAEADDQGAAYGKLAQALEQLGRTDEARTAYEQGIATATRHGHPGLASELELALADMVS